ncbi:MAG: hypothetical protein R3Y10_05480, partial [Ferrimonas sp.]
HKHRPDEVVVGVIGRIPFQKKRRTLAHSTVSACPTPMRESHQSGGIRGVVLPYSPAIFQNQSQYAL